MRFSFFVLLLPAFLLSSCANEGVIVRKDTSPLPFYQSLGVDGSYKLALRDSSGAIRSQLVTPEVFEDYAEGERFNDLQPAPAPNERLPGDKEMAALHSATGLTARSVRSGKSGTGNRFAAKGNQPSRGAALMQARTSTHSRVTVAKTTPAQTLVSAAVKKSVAPVQRFAATPPAPSRVATRTPASTAPATQPGPIVFTYAIARSPQNSTVTQPTLSTVAAPSSLRSHPTSKHLQPKKQVRRSAAKHPEE